MAVNNMKQKLLINLKSKIMNNLENRRNKINRCMSELFNLYVENKKQIVASVEMDGVKCKLVFEEEHPSICEGEVSTVRKKQTNNTEPLKNVVIHCKTEKEAIECCNLADKLGFKWLYGYDGRFTDLTHWEDYREDTAYDFYEGTYGHFDECKNSGCKIHSAQWFIDNFKIKD